MGNGLFQTEERGISINACRADFKCLVGEVLNVVGSGSALPMMSAAVSLSIGLPPFVARRRK